MTVPRLVSRRILLKDMGKAGLAVVVFGVAACSDEPTSNAIPTDEPAPSTTGAGPTTTHAETDQTEPEGTTSTAGQSAAGHEWHRVNLGFVSAYILYREGEAAIVDTGNPGNEGDIEAGLSEIGLGWDSVGHVIVTHRHPDHQGSVEAVLAATSAPWYAGAGDINAITASTEGEVVGDGAIVFGLQIIETPGHTAGHISVLDQVSGILVAGDALNGADGGVAGANPQFSDDMAAADQSVAKLAGFDYEVALFGHGEPVLEGASAAVSDLAASLG